MSDVNELDDIPPTSPSTIPPTNINIKEKQTFQCELCNESYTRKVNLKDHQLKKHGIVGDENERLTRTKCLYPDCSRDFFHKTKLFEHLEKEHGTQLQSSTHCFNSLAEFQKWKEDVEAEQVVFFSKQFKSSRSKLGVTLHFICQRDGDGKAHRKAGEMEPKSSRKNRKGKVKDGLILSCTNESDRIR